MPLTALAVDPPRDNTGATFPNQQNNTGQPGNNQTGNNQTKTNGTLSGPSSYDGAGESLPEITSPTRANSLEGLVLDVIQYSLSIIALAAIIVIIIAGLRMIVGSGNESQRTKSKQAITWAILGLILALLSFSIVTMVQRILQP